MNEKKGEGSRGREAVLFTCVALIGFKRLFFKNKYGQGMRKYRLPQHGITVSVYYVGCQRAQKISNFRQPLAGCCVVPGCQSVGAMRRAACGPKCPFQRVSHEFLVVPVMMDLLDYYVQHLGGRWLPATTSQWFVARGGLGFPGDPGPGRFAVNYGMNPGLVGKSSSSGDL